MDKNESAVRIAERLLARPEGATMDEVIAATGGPHYNLLRRLAARGGAIRKVREGRATRYFVSMPTDRSFELRLSDKGQVTIPHALRDLLKLRPGDRLLATVEDGEHLKIGRERTTLGDLVGVLPKPKRPVTVSEMNEAIRKAAAERIR
ncbi:hypothetical protein BH10PSE9_BH10PSE9_11600 [soil metagenome]